MLKPIKHALSERHVPIHSPPHVILAVLQAYVFKEANSTESDEAVAVVSGVLKKNDFTTTCRPQKCFRQLVERLA
jgi:hypothetical protein